MSDKKYNVSYGYEYVNHKLIHAPIVTEAQINIPFLKKIQYFIKDHWMLIVAAICEFFVLYIDPSLIPQAIMFFMLSFVFTFIMLRL